METLRAREGDITSLNLFSGVECEFASLFSKGQTVSKLLPCPVCEFSGPNCICTRPNPLLVLGDAEYWLAHITEAAELSVRAHQRVRQSGVSSNWRQKQRVENQSFRLADIAWLLHHGHWPAGYVELLDGPSLVASNLLLHPLPRHLPRDRSKLRGARQESPGRWTALVSRGCFVPLGSFLTPEEAHIAFDVLSAKLSAAEDPHRVWVG